jgi:two-component system, chemotaxis family, sensor kinase CheA
MFFNDFKLGKYRDLMFAILLFLVLDLGVLFFNVYASYQIERDVTRINLAGYQRALSQSMEKSVFSLQQEKRDNLPLDNSLKELSQSTQQFDSALIELKAGHIENPLFSLFGLNTIAIAKAADAVTPVWAEFKAPLKPLLTGSAFTTEEIASAATAIKATNGRLLETSNALVTEVQLAADIKAQSMRWIQLTAILLALANFIYILFKFLRQLGEADQTTDSARKQTSDILSTVDEGLMLVDAQGKIGSQMSSAVHTLFERQVLAGEDFKRVIAEKVSHERADDIEMYINLLFDPKVKPALLVQLDPMKEVEIESTSALALNGKRYLNFNLRQLREEDLITGLLVTIFDVTAQVKLARELANTQSAAKSDVEDLLRVFEQEPATMQEFLTVSKRKLNQLNESMRTVGKTPSSYKALIKSTTILIHGIKGESAALNLEGVSRQSHAMEDTLVELLKKPDLTGEDLIHVVYELSQVQEQIERIERLFMRIASNPQLSAPQTLSSPLPNPTPAPKTTPVLTDLPVLKQTVSPGVKPTDTAPFAAHEVAPADVGKPPFSAARVLENKGTSNGLAPITMMFSANTPPLEEMANNLNALASTVGQSLNKAIQFTHSIDAIMPSGLMLRALREVLPQLVRNSVVHGIESHEKRASLGKPAAGALELRIIKVSNELTEVSLQDDGCGITVEGIRKRLVSMNVDVSNMSQTQILQSIFEPQFSTADAVTEHAGRGVGLSLVKEVLEKAGAKLKVNTRAGQSTQFVIQFGNGL